MAKLNTVELKITVSELVPNNQQSTDILDADKLSALIDVIQELVGPGRLVEVDA